jgi:hypothetical protein
MAYTIYKSDGSLFLTLDDGQIDTSNTSLTLVGKNVVNYGQYENSNSIRILENFANRESPPNPIAGQLWFDKTSSILRLKVFNGTSWNSLPNFVYSPSTPTLNSGDFWWKSDSQELYIRSGSSTLLIAGSSLNASAASKLATPRKINNVDFDGTADITVSSTLTNKLLFGPYITGTGFDGSVETTINVDVGTVNQPTPSAVVARDNNGDVWFRIGHGIATASQYADLAEKYLSDADYDAGTVMTVGGSAEVTKCSEGDRAIGVVSANPGFMMNKDLVGGTYIALKGRVPIRTHGIIKKQQRLIAGPNGTAIAALTSNPDVFAIALEDSNDTGIIEAVIL